MPLTPAEAISQHVQMLIIPHTLAHLFSRRFSAHVPYSYHSFSPRLEIPSLPLLDTRSWFTLIRIDRMHHDLIRILRIIASITLTPVITNCISEDISIFVERRCRDSAANCRIALESVFRYSVPEMERAV